MIPFLDKQIERKTLSTIDFKSAETDMGCKK